MRADPLSAAGEAFRLWLRHPLAILALWLPVAALNAVALSALESYRQGAGLPLDPFAMSDADRLRYLGVALPLTLATFAFELAVWGVVAAWAGDRRGRGGLLAAAGRRFGAFVALGLLLTLVLSAGLALLIVPFFVFLHWFLFAPAALADGKGIGGALEASRKFARERRTYGFTALVVLLGVLTLVVESLLAAGLASLLEALGVPSGYALAVAPALAAWPFAPLLPLLPAAYWFIAKEDAAPPPAPGPAPAPGTAAERFRTTKCPQCGTLVPYTATGEPVDVACPVCGRAGRVL